MRKAVLIGLADNTNNDGVCFPSYQHIADKTEMSKRSVIRHVNDLEKLGFISKQERHLPTGFNRSNTYRLMLNGGKDPITDIAEIVIHSSDRVSPSSDRVSPPTSDRVSPITYHSSNLSLKRVREPHKENNNNEFKKPSVAEIKNYCELINSEVSPDRFHEHYEKTDWYSGNQKIKDWQKAVRFWDEKKREKAKLSLPQDDSKLEGWAKSVGLRGPRAGETFQQYRVALRTEFNTKSNEGKR